MHATGIDVPLCPHVCLQTILLVSICSSARSDVNDCCYALRVIDLAAMFGTVRCERAPRREDAATLHAHEVVVTLARWHSVGVMSHQMYLERAILGGGILAVCTLERLLT